MTAADGTRLDGWYRQASAPVNVLALQSRGYGRDPEAVGGHAYDVALRRFGQECVPSEKHP